MMPAAKRFWRTITTQRGQVQKNNHTSTPDYSIARLSHGKKHLPTGHISLADIARCLITEFAIPPLRTDWADILAAAPGTIQSGSTI